MTQTRHFIPPHAWESTGNSCRQKRFLFLYTHSTAKTLAAKTLEELFPQTNVCLTSAWSLLYLFKQRTPAMMPLWKPAADQAGSPLKGVFPSGDVPHSSDDRSVSLRARSVYSPLAFYPNIPQMLPDAAPSDVWTPASFFQSNLPRIRFVEKSSAAHSFTQLLRKPHPHPCSMTQSEPALFLKELYLHVGRITMVVKKTPVTQSICVLTKTKKTYITLSFKGKFDAAEVSFWPIFTSSTDFHFSSPGWGPEHLSHFFMKERQNFMLTPGATSEGNPVRFRRVRTNDTIMVLLKAKKEKKKAAGAWQSMAPSAGADRVEVWTPDGRVRLCLQCSAPKGTSCLQNTQKIKKYVFFPPWSLQMFH